MVQRFMIVTVLSVLVLTIIGAVSLSPAYATCIFTATLSSSMIVQGGSLTLSGQDTCGGQSGEALFANTYETSSCPPTGLPSGTQVGGDGLNPVVGTYSGLPITFFTSPPGFGGPGTYCVHVWSASVPDADGVNVAFTVTSAAPIPEYPLGIPILAIFMIIAYGVIRRKTRYD
jgi:hypothetical protein